VLTKPAGSVNLNYTSAEIVKEGEYDGQNYIDVSFLAPGAGELHWVIFSGLAGAYQYFVNRELPTMGEFRTLWRLDNETFTSGHTDVKDGLLPPLEDYKSWLKVQDETWLQPNGSGYITKYDWTSWIRTQTYYGVYGDGFGSWYINPGKDYYNGNHLKQELMVGILCLPRTSCLISRNYLASTDLTVHRFIANHQRVMLFNSI
jgi:rhamnogalacturonan endolyase